jgi:transposase
MNAIKRTNRSNGADSIISTLSCVLVGGGNIPPRLSQAVTLRSIFFGTYFSAVPHTSAFPQFNNFGHTRRRSRAACITNNLSPHKSDPTLALITQAGAQVLFLPAYSPDLNPIEKMWSKVKALLRTAEARTPADLVRAIGHALTQVTAQDALGWFASCGYSFC